MHSKVLPGDFLEEACAGSGAGWEEGGSPGDVNQQPTSSSWADLLQWRTQQESQQEPSKGKAFGND